MVLFKARCNGPRLYPAFWDRLVLSSLLFTQAGDTVLGPVSIREDQRRIFQSASLSPCCQMLLRKCGNQHVGIGFVS